MPTITKFLHCQGVNRSSFAETTRIPVRASGKTGWASSKVPESLEILSAFGQQFFYACCENLFFEIQPRGLKPETQRSWDYYSVNSAHRLRYILHWFWFIRDWNTWQRMKASGAQVRKKEPTAHLVLIGEYWPMCSAGLPMISSVCVF